MKSLLQRGQIVHLSDWDKPLVSLSAAQVCHCSIKVQTGNRHMSFDFFCVPTKLYYQNSGGL